MSPPIDPFILKQASVLQPHELPWKDLSEFFLAKGYQFRPRYTSLWTPSWVNTGRSPTRCEDFYSLPLYSEIIDAKRIVDGKFVQIKRTKTGSREVEMALKYSQPPYSNDPANHFAPILELIRDNNDKSISYLVMPYLRKADDPFFEVVGDIVDLADQLFEGLAFMHNQNIAHRNPTYENLVMDAVSMYPKGFHPIQTGMKPDLSGPAKYVSRRKAAQPVRYYYFDFSNAFEGASGDNTSALVAGKTGLDIDAPELESGAPYNPFKLDVYVLGTYLREAVLECYGNAAFLAPLIQAMTSLNPVSRPDAMTIVREWANIKKGITGDQRVQKLHVISGSSADVRDGTSTSFLKGLFSSGH